MQKTNSHSFIIICIAALLILPISIGSFFIGKTHSGNSAGIERNLDRERELLARIGEYEQREEARIAREAERIAREGERIERTKIQLGAIRELDRRSGGLLSELEQEINILAGYFRDSVDGFNNGANFNGDQ